MKWLRWENGRTSPYNYKKMLLAMIPGFADCYLLYFPTGSSIDWHTDPVEGKAHHRVNVYLTRAKKGGRLFSKRIVLDGERRGAVRLTLKHKSRFNYMRSDIVPHAVEQVEEGSCLVLSIGWVLSTAPVTTLGPR